MNRKITLLIAALFALTACSEDVYQEIDQQNEDFNAPPTFNDTDPGYFAPGSGSNQAGGNYVSPWDIWTRAASPFRPHYTFINAGEGGISPYILRITPYIGLAYYDSNENGWFTDISTNPPTPIAHLANGNYPHLFASGKEAGNMIIGEPFEMLGDGTPGENEAAVGGATDYLPLDFSTFGLGYNPKHKRFNIMPTGATMDEYALLAEYGKVFYYYVELVDKVTNATVFSTEMQLENEPLDVYNDPLWRYLYPGTAPSADIHYYESVAGTGTQWPGANGTLSNPSICDSREIVFKKFAEHSIDVGSISGGVIPGFLTLEMGQGDQLWENSGMILKYSLY